MNANLRSSALRRLVAVLVCVGATSCGVAAPAGQTPAAESTQSIASAVSATGRVLPVRWAALALSASGEVKQVLVREGDLVDAGQLLAEVSLPEAEAALLQANAGIGVARAALARLEAKARPVELAGAQAAVDAAREGVKAAEIAHETALKNVAVAEAGVAAAQAVLRRLRAGATPEQLEIAKQNVEMAKAQLWAAQGQRDALGGLRDRAGQGDPLAGLAYQTGSYDSARGQVMAGETSVTIADLNLRQLAAGARPEEIAATEAQVKQAEASMQAMQAQAHAAEQQIAINQQQVRQAQAQLDLLQAPPREEDLATARAQVAQAEAVLAGAEAAMEKAHLRAPFAGTVTEITLRAGEYAVAGLPALTLGDLTMLRVETTDLDEIDVSRIQVGRAASLTFDALPETTLRGRVEQIALKAGSGGGGTTYKVTLSLVDTDARLRWGMTAFAEIATE